MITITLHDKDWTRDEIERGWKDDEALSQEQIDERVDTEIAYIINEIHKFLGYGWTHDSTAGTFTGPYIKGQDPVAKILDLLTAAADYAIEADYEA